MNSVFSTNIAFSGLFSGAASVAAGPLDAGKMTSTVPVDLGIDVFSEPGIPDEFAPLVQPDAEFGLAFHPLLAPPSLNPSGQFAQLFATGGSANSSATESTRAGIRCDGEGGEPRRRKTTKPRVSRRPAEGPASPPPPAERARIGTLPGIPLQTGVPSIEFPNKDLVRLWKDFKTLREGQEGKGGLSIYHGVATKSINAGRIETTIKALAVINHRLEVFLEDFQNHFGTFLAELNQRSDMAAFARARIWEMARASQGQPAETRPSISAEQSNLLGKLWHAVQAEIQKLQGALGKAEERMAELAEDKENPRAEGDQDFRIDVLKGDWKRRDLKHLERAYDVLGWTAVYREAEAAYDKARIFCTGRKMWKTLYRIEFRKAQLLLDAYLFNEELRGREIITMQIPASDPITSAAFLEARTEIALARKAFREALALARTRAQILRQAAIRKRQAGGAKTAASLLLDSVRQLSGVMGEIVSAGDGSLPDAPEVQSGDTLIPFSVHSEIIEDVELAIKIYREDSNSQTSRRDGLINVFRVLATDLYKDIFRNNLQDVQVLHQRAALDKLKAGSGPSGNRYFQLTVFAKAIADIFLNISNYLSAMGDVNASAKAQEWALKLLNTAVNIEFRLGLHAAMAETLQTMASLSAVVARRDMELRGTAEKSPSAQSVPPVLTPIAGVRVVELPREVEAEAPQTPARAAPVAAPKRRGNTPAPAADANIPPEFAPPAPADAIAAQAAPPAPAATYSAARAPAKPRRRAFTDPRGWTVTLGITPPQGVPVTAADTAREHEMDAGIVALNLLEITGVRYKVFSSGEMRDANPIESLLRHYHSVRLALALAARIAKDLPNPVIPVDKLLETAKELEDRRPDSTFARLSTPLETADDVDTELTAADIMRWNFWDDGAWVDVFKRNPNGSTTRESLRLESAMKKIGLTPEQFRAMRDSLALNNVEPLRVK